MFALADDLIYYSSEIKQYSSDVAIALGLLLYVFISDKCCARSYVTFAFLGCLAVWFSFPVVFVVAGGIDLDRPKPAAARLMRAWR